MHQIQRLQVFENTRKQAPVAAAVAQCDCICGDILQVLFNLCATNTSQARCQMMSGHKKQISLGVKSIFIEKGNQFYSGLLASTVTSQKKRS